jgi:ubiquinone biosynthesis protein UbiJ
MRFLLKRSFAATPEKTDWEDLLVSRLGDVPAEPVTRGADAASVAPAGAVHGGGERLDSSGKASGD